jgi:Domain of unknown function (DUF4389)
VSRIPVSFEADYVEKRSRLTTFFRLILVIPHLLLAALWGFATFFVVVVAWFALLFTGRWPRELYDFTAGYLRYTTYVYGYMLLLTDEYPPFNGSADAGFPNRLNIGEPKSAYDRLKVLLRIFLIIPVAIVMYAMQIVYGVGAFLAWFAILILGRQPRGLQDMIALGLSYQQRGYAYAFLVDEQFPPFTTPQPALESGPGAETPLPPAPPAPSAVDAPATPEPGKG